LIGYNVFKPFAKGDIPLDLYANQIAFLTFISIAGSRSSKQVTHTSHSRPVKTF
jgi:hypothetical protein